MHGSSLRVDEAKRLGCSSVNQQIVPSPSLLCAFSCTGNPHLRILRRSALFKGLRDDAGRRLGFQVLRASEADRQIPSIFYTSRARACRGNFGPSESR